MTGLRPYALRIVAVASLTSLGLPLAGCTGDSRDNAAPLAVEVPSSVPAPSAEAAETEGVMPAVRVSGDGYSYALPVGWTKGSSRSSGAAASHRRHCVGLPARSR